jgi:spore germination protein Q
MSCCGDSSYYPMNYYPSFYPSSMVRESGAQQSSGFQGTMPPGSPGMMPPGFEGAMPAGSPGMMSPGFEGAMPPGSPGMMPPGFEGAMSPGSPGMMSPGFEGGMSGSQGGPSGFQGGMGPSFAVPVVPMGTGQQLPTGRVEESFIENILRFNKGKVGTFYFTYQGNSKWNAMVYHGRVETAGRDHLIISDPSTGKRFLLLMANLDWVEFDEEINYPLMQINPEVQASLTTTGSD